MHDNPSPPTTSDAESALDILQEYADNRGITLRVDRERGIIPGVKLLGTVSKKGREYPKEVMAKALPLYEGMRVNIDHVDPGQRRSLRDRIGLVKNVTLKEDGLYGDFHFNPKHPLADQIAWDAENAPQNLGFSHDTRGGSRNVGGRLVVESIDKVLSVDLVANPATTTGLFEGLEEMLNQPASPARSDTPTPESHVMNWNDIDLDGLKRNRPELLTALQESREKSDELAALQEELKTLKQEKAARELEESITGQLKAAGLDPANRLHVSEVFMEDLRTTADAAQRKAKIDDRRALVGTTRTAATPVTGSPLLEGQDGLPFPPANAPLAQRISRFTR
jgi:hypothetical protein